MVITNTNEIIGKIQESSHVLVGIGQEWQVTMDEMLCEPEFSSKYQELEKLDEETKQYQLQFLISDYYEKNMPDRLREAYNVLKELLGEKNYFIVTLMTDDYISQDGFRRENTVAPCGNFKQLQCGQNCSEILIDKKELLSNTCQNCGGALYYNNIYAPKYNEQGYLPQWERYMKWLQGTVNKNLVMLELGVGLELASVIRWPFEKTLTYNQKAQLLRINETFSMLPENMSERGFRLQKDSVDVIIACKNADISL